ncbi:MAG: rhamnulokinase [Clostridia bacterium]|nr:rhamnulokinase [Clostridia bacterium]
MNYYLAVDIGASSGRHIIGWVQDGKMMLEEVYRFENNLQKKNGSLCWDTDHLFASIVEGMKACKQAGKIPTTMGIDTWAVDFVLLDQQGNRLGDTVGYRDSRTEGMDKLAEQTLSFEELYAKTGIQKQLFNTLYQLLAVKKANPQLLEQAKRFLMIPEYFNYRLTGVAKNEYTNATSTAMVNAHTKTWDTELMNLYGIPTHLFGDLAMPGETVGNLLPELREQVGFDCTVILPATHDTGSAFLAVPAQNDTSVYISSGTWSLLGVENKQAITTPQSAKANFTNEGGYEYRFRYLKNIMGLWMIQSIRRNFDKRYSFADLENMAKECADFPSVVDVNHPDFLAPESMVEAVKNRCAATGQAVPQSVGELMQCVYQSLARSYAEAIKELSQLTGVTYTHIHIVGGGSKDGYLNSLTAKATGLPVMAGPTEGTALGNLMVQMIGGGDFADLQAARAAIGNSFELKNF